MLDRTFGITSTDDEIQEVANSNASGQNTSLETSTSSTDDPDTEPTQKNKITCPICMDDENTVSTFLTLSVPLRGFWWGGGGGGGGYFPEDVVETGW